MKFIALEEAFAIEGLRMGSKAVDTPVPIDDAIMAEWKKRLVDLTEWRLPEMDANGVATQVLSLPAPAIQAAPSTEIAVEDARTANDYLAAVTFRFPGRFKGFAALPLQDPDVATKELRRCVKELGFCGALVNDHTNGRYLDEPEFAGLWRELQELDVPLYIHPGAPRTEAWGVLNGYPQLIGPTWSWNAEVASHALRLVYGGVFDRYPNAKIILGHMGEFLPFQLWRLDSRYKTLKTQGLARMPSEYFGRNIFITTSGVCSHAALVGAVMALGEDAVMFSVDYPYESTELAVEFIQTAPLSESVKEKLAWRNAARLLHLD
ncbi:amidohydrolase family protein [Paraburkholderia sp.]|uniref:amidohydrolase family protein n=1 Tax=Paraburkholderia sp. TaxID=1926495 RepID=UPI003C7AFE1B